VSEWQIRPAQTDRAAARLVGGLFILGTVTGAVGLALSQPLLDAPDYLRQVHLHQDRVATAALLTLTMGVALVGVSIVVHPVLRRHSPRWALSYVVARAVESLFYVIDVVLLLTLVTVGRGSVDAGATDAAHLQALGDSVLGAREWTAAVLDLTAFGLSALILNYVLYRARLVPRWLSAWGLAAASLYSAAGAMVMYGLEPLSTTQVVLNAPLGLQEMALAIWLIVKGFDAPAPVDAPHAEAVAARA
jgi:hypothetical protein